MSDETPPGLPPSEFEDEGKERRSYLVGFALALFLTASAFGLVTHELVSGGLALLSLGGLALLQIVVHFRCFLLIDLRRSHRDDLLLILFTTLIVALMVGGTIWILFDQHARMMGG